MTSSQATVAPPAENKKIGIVAGWGSFPVELAEHLAANGYDVYIAAVKDHAYQEIADHAVDCRWFGVLKIGAHMRYFARNGVHQVAFAGKIFKDKILYHGMGWIGHLPDWTCLKTVVGPSFISRKKDGRDDTLLLALTDAYSSRGMEILEIDNVAPHLLVEEGCITRRRPSRGQLRDVQFGWTIARQMGGLDIGQSVTVKDQLVLGVEAVEGTDALVTRTASMCPRGGFTLVKVAKPRQDMRFDVPTIGVRTVQRVAEAGGAAIAIEAGKTILVDRQETIDEANRLGIAIFCIASSSPAQQQPSGSTKTESLRCGDLLPRPRAA